MEEVRGVNTWREELASLVEDTGIIYAGEPVIPTRPRKLVNDEPELERESLKDQVTGFLKSWGEMLLELGKGCKDILQQTVITEDSFIVQKLRGPVAKVSGRLRFLNEFLPEDRDPVHAWPVVFFVFILALSALGGFSTNRDNLVAQVKKVRIHPPSASRILLPDGRNLAYHEQGVPASRARYSLIAPHSFLSSRLAGIPGIKTSLLEEFGVRLVTYDLPGFGESDPHPSRNLNSSASDILCLADAVGVNDKFWVLGYSSGSMHAWAALRYIPSQSCRCCHHGPIDKWMSVSLKKKDEVLIEDPIFEEYWHRDVEESIRQGNTKPFIEEAVLQVSNWGFSLADLQVRKECQSRGFLPWLRSMYSQEKCELAGFLGPIHIWQGMEDQVVPPSVIDYISRVLPAAVVHKLPYEGHFSYFFFCDQCHREIFSTLFGSSQGPLIEKMETDETPSKAEMEKEKGLTDSSSTE
ncbi:alpha/beta-Hydrolases superfamily protein [Melia azedarach]|uniref:Alpha/beta-Hydrolases superfamily protein n=1 Tax=Melia azedarach TaxID=155640 RepID=A0ACC1X061_MELAZ|nr:alpha/beta-Hydrolases superfamily protein [Melia azedarach]